MASTLLLDRTTWDLVVDSSGNIAVASDPYSIGQDVASRIRLMEGDAWYDSTQGLPYFTEILGELPSLQFIKTQIVAQAMMVPGVVSASVTLTGLSSSSETQIVSTTKTLTTASGSPVLTSQGNTVLVTGKSTKGLVILGRVLQGTVTVTTADGTVQVSI